LDVTALTLDVTDPESIASAARAIDARHGCLDILINNAGINPRDGTTRVSEQRLATWHAVFETNLFGLIAVTQAFLPVLRKSAAGRIVNLSSGQTVHSSTWAKRCLGDAGVQFLGRQPWIQSRSHC
jgi:NAD(P)-dependent dehydrogenase (short-subunit alcohol dehydrogenase family)